MVERGVGERIVAHGRTYAPVFPLQQLLRGHVRLIGGISPELAAHIAVEPFRSGLGKTVGKGLEDQGAVIVATLP